MYRQNESVQRMIDWVEGHLEGGPVLLELARQVGYSPYYCSEMFHRVCGCTLKSYVARRRLASAAQELAGSSGRILDIAIKYGFSSQEAFTRAFRTAFGCTPAAYRSHPVPVPLFLRKEVFSPWHYEKLYQGGTEMSTHDLKTPNIRVEYIPAHRYIGIWDDQARCYDEFWNNHDCDQVCGIIESMCKSAHPVVTPHTAGWHYVKGERRYFYGLGVPEDYNGPVPEGFEIRSFPASYYLVFVHPPFCYMEDNGEVMRRVEELAWNYDLPSGQLAPNGLSTDAGSGRFAWNEDACQCYQRHYPEVIGYEVLRPVRLISQA